MIELFKYQFFIHAILAACLTSIIGTYIVSRRIVFISGGISHASFGGIGIGYFLGINPIFGAAVFSTFSAIGIEALSKKSGLRKDSLIGLVCIHHTGVCVGSDGVSFWKHSNRIFI